MTILTAAAALAKPAAALTLMAAVAWVIVYWRDSSARYFAGADDALAGHPGFLPEDIAGLERDELLERIHARQVEAEVAELEQMFAAPAVQR